MTTEFLCIPTWVLVGRQAYVLLTTPHLRVSLGVYSSKSHMSTQDQIVGMGLTQKRAWEEERDGDVFLPELGRADGNHVSVPNNMEVRVNM